VTCVDSWEGGAEHKADTLSFPGLGDLEVIIFFFFTLVTGPRRSLSLKLSDTRVYAPQIRDLEVTAPSARNPKPET